MEGFRVDTWILGGHKTRNRCATPSHTFWLAAENYTQPCARIKTCPKILRTCDLHKGFRFSAKPCEQVVMAQVDSG